MGRPRALTNAQVVDFLTVHKAENARELLESCGLDTDGSKDELLQRISSAVRTQKISIDTLIERLDEIEGWGNQHVYLFDTPAALTKRWREKEHVRGILREKRKLYLFNRRIPLLLPENWTLSTIQWTDERVRFVWVTTRKWDERDPMHDKRSGNRVWKAFNRRVARGILSFDWDLLNQTAMLMIERLPTGSKYDEVRLALIKELHPIVDVLSFKRVALHAAIPLIENSSEVRSRQLALMTPKRGVANFTSPSRKQDVSQDPDLQRSRDGLGDDTAGQLGNFYWLRCAQLKTEVHTTLYASEDRLGIFGEHSEEVVRHVIGRIRYYCGQVQ